MKLQHKWKRRAPEAKLGSGQWMVGERKKASLFMGHGCWQVASASVHSPYLCAWGLTNGTEKANTNKNEEPKVVRDKGWGHKDELEEENDGCV